MNQLELRFYSRQEIAEVLNINIKDSSHFKRNVENKLQKWGYEFEYSRQGVAITKRPETKEARLKEILIRELSLDTQINPYDFACFFTAFNDIDGFASMPWGKRESVLSNVYNVNVSDRTLRSWCARMIDRDIIRKDEGKTLRTYWKTVITESGKERSLVEEEDQEEMRVYFSRRAELVAEGAQFLLESGLPMKEAKQKAWDQAYKQLWSEFQCCYYSCKGFEFNALTPSMFVILEITRELAPAADNNRKDKQDGE